MVHDIYQLIQNVSNKHRHLPWSAHLAKVLSPQPSAGLRDKVAKFEI
jgi:hypothetical protein